MGNTDSRTIFRDQIQHLLNENIPDSETEFWDMFFTLPVTSEDVFAMVLSDDVRKLIDDKPNNLYHIIEYSLIFMDEAWQQVEELNSNRMIAVNNAVRFLTRIVPFTLENQERTGFYEFWWGENPRAFRLLKACVGLMFTPLYSVVASLQRTSIDNFNQVELALLWKGGLLTPNIGEDVSTQMWDNRYELLRLLLACIGENMYEEMSKMSERVNPWLWLLCSQAIPFSAQLFYSIVNILISYDPYGMWNLPYASYWSSAVKERALQSSLDILVLMLEFVPPNDERLNKLKPHELRAKQLIETRQVTQGALFRNEMQLRLRDISKDEDFQKIITGFNKIVTTGIVAQNTYLPSSQKIVPCTEEILILLWLLIESNEKFYNYLIKSNAKELIVPIIYCILEKMESVSHYGLLCIITNILIKLSENRKFSVSLNAKYSGNLPVSFPNFNGTYADVLIITVGKIIQAGNQALEGIYPSLLIIITNISPYLKSLSVVSSQTIMRFFETFSLQRWLLASPTNHYLIFYVLEIIANLIQYQWQASSYLILYIIRKKDLFVKLNKLKLEEEENNKEETKKSEESKKSEEAGVEEEKIPENRIIGLLSERVEEKVVNSSILQSHVSAESDEIENTNTAQNLPSEEDWKPSQQWLASWKKKLPMAVPMICIQELLPELESYTLKNPKCQDKELIDLIQEEVLVGILPVPHPIVTRKYLNNPITRLWLSCSIWGIIYLKNQYMPLYDPKNIKMFSVQFE
ncbi:unnamed protein product [Blepharisma stoltei]|uniref:Uncharacterized protein n=1 Tax=Blepharisma stoltei TaxID=1481888 RepID=A0AAU9K7J2_9CILI|nr:unnamed protein product [Blepharisma stoltei]